MLVFSAQVIDDLWERAFKANCVVFLHQNFSMQLQQLLASKCFSTHESRGNRD
jgi:hypothetical protein